MSVSFSNIVGTLGSSTLTTKGDILTHDGTSVSRLPVGSSGQVLSAQSSTGTGLLWSSQALGPAGPVRLIASSTITANTATVSFTGLTATNTYKMYVINGVARCTADTAVINLAGDTNGISFRGFFAFARQGGTITYERNVTSTALYARINGSCASSNTSSLFGSFTYIIGTSGGYLGCIAEAFGFGTLVTDEMHLSSGSWYTSGPSSQISLYHTSGSFAPGSKIFVYGIEA